MDIDSFAKYMNLVDRFKSDLKRCGVEIEEWKKGNGCILKKGEVSVGALIKEYTPQHSHTTDQGLWGVGKESFEGVQHQNQENDRDGCVVFLLGNFEGKTLNVGYWVTSENFNTGRVYLFLDLNKQYKIHLGDLEGEGNRLSAKEFSTVQDFLQLSGLHPPETTSLVNMQRDIKD